MKKKLTRMLCVISAVIMILGLAGAAAPMQARADAEEPGSITVPDDFFPDDSIVGKIFDATVGNLVRSAGIDRFDTSIMNADYLKQALGIDKFESIIVASSHSFPDALTGAYLAAISESPILIVKNDGQGQDVIEEYIRENLAPNGTVFILGGLSAVNAMTQAGLDAITENVKRLAGADRYLTNLLILAESGLKGGQILIADGVEFADALSASALGLPILLINKKNALLSEAQRLFLEGLDLTEITILGGAAAVPEAISEELQKMFPSATIERIAGKDRYETSAMIAARFFPDSTVATFATGVNFPDGLTGGALSHALGAPLLLTRNKFNSILRVADYVATNAIDRFLVFGGTSVIPDEVLETLRTLASLPIPDLKEMILNL